jgi:tetratricopeptide (TPR) repeat protein
MATAKITKKQMSQDEFIEGMFDFGEWLEVHWRRVAMGLGAAVVVVLAGIAWNASREKSAEAANRWLASGLEAYAPSSPASGQALAPRYDFALTQFEQAANSGGSQGVGDVARLFRARTLIALSRAPEAVPVLEGLVSNRSEAIATEAKLALAEATEAAGNPDRAASLLQEVASPAKAGTYPPDAAMLLLGGLRERQGKKDDAKRIYDDLLVRFPQSPFAADARQRSAALTATPR